MFHRITICRRDKNIGKNFVPPIKTRYPVVEAGKITFKDYHLIWWPKVVLVFTNFLTTNKL